MDNQFSKSDEESNKMGNTKSPNSSLAVPTSKSSLMLLFSDPCVHSATFLTGSMGLIMYEYFSQNKIIYSRLKKLPAPIIAIMFYVMKIVWTRILKQLSQGKQIPRELMQSTEMTTQTALVTGGVSGIGKATAIQLLKWGATVVIGIRKPSKIPEMKLEILGKANLLHNENKLLFYPLILDDMDSVGRFAQMIKENNHNISLLVNNAGIMTPKKCILSHLQLDPQFTTNHLGHFLLTYLLLNNLKKNNARIINVASLAHSNITREVDIKKLSKPNPDNYDTVLQYSFSKICNIWFTQELQRRLDEDKNTEATTYTCHPGLVSTNLAHDANFLVKNLFNLSVLIMKTPESGAATQLYLCSEDKQKLRPGCYYHNCRLSPCIEQCTNKSLCKELWEYSEELVAPYIATYKDSE